MAKKKKRGPTKEAKQAAKMSMVAKGKSNPKKKAKKKLKN